MYSHGCMHGTMNMELHSQGLAVGRVEPYPRCRIGLQGGPLCMRGFTPLQNHTSLE